MSALVEYKPPNILLKGEKQQLGEFIGQTFSDLPKKIGCKSIVEHKIRTNYPPIKQRHYPLSLVLQKQVNQELGQMLEDRIIEPSFLRKL